MIGNIRWVLFEEKGMWVGQILEHDIAAQGDDPDEVRSELLRGLAAHITLDIYSGIQPLSDIPPAPQEYFDRFRREEP